MIIETLEKFERYVSMRLYFFFPKVKAAGLYLVSNKIFDFYMDDRTDFEL